MKIRKLHDRLARSLFFVPMLFVIGAVTVGELMLATDERIGSLPSRLTATVDSARAVLTVVAGATLTFAAIAFSISLLLISLASSQYSPRVVHGLFRDPFNKRIMGIVIGTFTYCLVVLRAVRGPCEDSGQPVVPNLALLLAVILGVTSVLAIVAFISHSAHTMEVSVILNRVTKDAIAVACATWGEENVPPRPADLEPPPTGDAYAVTFDGHGWIQQLNHAALLQALEPGACMRVETTPGRYAIPGTVLCTIWPSPTNPDATLRTVRAAVVIGEARTMQQDLTYGIRQLADVALKALSPGINDPTTAQDALFHLGTVLHELMMRKPPARYLSGVDGRCVLLTQVITTRELVDLAFEIRIASSGQPSFQVYLLEILHLLIASLDQASDRQEHTDARIALRHQAQLVLDIANRSCLPSDDIERVRAAHRVRFADEPDHRGLPDR